jgi:putative transposase
MKKQYAYKFQLRPTGHMASKMGKVAGCCRFVWNKALAIQKDRLSKKERLLSYIDMAGLLVVWKKEELFLKEVHSQPLQQTIKNLDRALKSSFNKTNATRFPRFKKKYMHDSFLYPQGHRLEQQSARVYLPKIGWVCYRKSQSIEGMPKNVTVSRRCGKWYVSIQVEQDVQRPEHKSRAVLGIDVGIAKFAMCSDGNVIMPLNSFRKHEKRLVFLQRRLSRKKKFSNNWAKQKAKILRHHAKIADCRKDFLHKATDAISKNHAIVVMEDLQVSSMSRSAAGTIECKGNNVRAKAGLNKSILDQGWYEFRRQLEYKLLWRGGLLVLVNPRYTSQQCSDCGHCERENRKTQSLFLCKNCGHSENADLNAAKNIRAAGLAVIACGGYDIGQPMKQEPTVMSLNEKSSIQSESSCFS